MIDQLADEVALLERHLEILGYVLENEPIGIVALSDETGYAHHEVRYSLRVLEDNGVVEPTRQGAVTTDRAAEYFGEVNDTIDEAIERVDEMRFQVEQAAPQ